MSNELHKYTETSQVDVEIAQEQKKVKPVIVEDQALKGKIFTNKNEHGVFFNTQFTKSYQDKEGNWHETSNFGEKDLPQLHMLTGKTYDRIKEMRKEMFKEKRQSQAQSRDQGKSRDQHSR